MSVTWGSALAEAVAYWERGIRHLGPGPVALALACLVAGSLCWAGAHACRRAGATYAGWNAAAFVLAGLAAHTVLRPDLFAIALLRAVAQADGWYGARRSLQGGLLVVVALGATAALPAVGRRLAGAGLHARLAIAGVGAAGGVAVLRAVSLHATDRLLAWPLAAVSAGRLVEVAAVGLTAAAAWHRVQAA